MQNIHKSGKYGSALTSMKPLLSKDQQIRVKRHRFLPNGHIHDDTSRPGSLARGLQRLRQARAVKRRCRTSSVVARRFHSSDDIFVDRVHDLGGAEALGLRLSLGGYLGDGDATSAFGFAALDHAESDWAGAHDENVGSRLDVAFSDSAPAD